MQAAQDRFYLPAIDGLRFVAFLMVFIHHLGPHPGGEGIISFLYRNGWIGVEMLFAVSAFVLTSLMIKEYAARGRVSVRRFLLRRALRLWPGYFVYLAAVTLYLAAQGPLPQGYAPRLATLSSFTDNFYTAYISYGHPWLAHLWTVSFEQQVYLLLPLLFCLLFPCLQHRARAAILLAAAAVAGFYALRLFWLSLELADPPLIPLALPLYPLPFLRPDSLIAGALAAYLYATGRLAPWLEKSALWLAAAIFACLYAWSREDAEFLNPHRSAPIYACLAPALFFLLIGLTDPQRFAARALAWKPVNFLGRITYGLYLYHLLALQLPGSARPNVIHWLESWISDGWTAPFLVSLALAIAFASASYYLVERPFLRLKERYTFIRNRKI